MATGSMVGGGEGGHRYPGSCPASQGREGDPCSPSNKEAEPRKLVCKGLHRPRASCARAQSLEPQWWRL